MMRPSWLIVVIGLALAAGCSGGRDTELLGEPEPEQVAATEAPAEEFDAGEGLDAPADSLEMFADLRFYGSWFDIYPYGWVWRPIVVSDWAPMTLGHWVWTIYGWMWVSYDPFGWATYNYGYWVNDFTFGWVWVPECQWYPVRCEWLTWDDYVGWAPYPAPGVRFRDPWQQADYDPWVVIPTGKFKNTEVARYRVPAKFKAGSSERTLRREAPESQTIERLTGSAIQATDITLDRVPVGGQQLTRVVLPPQEQAIVEQQRGRMKSPPPPLPPPPPANDGGSKGSDDSVERPAKEKATPPPAKKEPPAKFKEKNAKEKDAQEKKKDGDSKDEGKGKGR
jgi:hypothetical protein